MILDIYIRERGWVGFHAAYLIDKNDIVTYDTPHLKFFDQKIQNQLKTIGVSSLFLKEIKVQDANGGFFPSYERLKSEGVVNQLERIYESKEYFPYYL